MPGYKKPKMTGETRKQIKEREERLQKESRERARKKREDFMSGKGKKPNAHHPMKFEDQKGTGPGITKADKIAVAQNGYNPKLYKPEMKKGSYTMKLGRESATRNTPGPFRAEVPYMYEATKPLMFRGQIRKASDTAKKADKAYRSEGNKNDPDYMKMMNKRK